ncbi:hypothetical protein BTE77_35965, partial [Ensifer adhaerens]
MLTRFLSPALHTQDALALVTAPLGGVEGKIYNNLWNAVIDHKLRPGTKIDEAVLGEIYGISRTVIRKVLFIMEQEGIVHLPVNRGAYVASPSREDAEQLLEAIETLLLAFAQKLASNPQAISAKDRERLERHLEAEAK